MLGWEESVRRTQRGPRFGLIVGENSNSIDMIGLRKMTLVEDVTVVETPEETELIDDWEKFYKPSPKLII